jgi:hypothetical protein
MNNNRIKPLNNQKFPKGQLYSNYQKNHNINSLLNIQQLKNHLVNDKAESKLGGCMTKSELANLKKRIEPLNKK